VAFGRKSRQRGEQRLERMFETRSEAWEAVGLSVTIDERATRRAWREFVVLLPLLAGVIFVSVNTYDKKGNRHGWFPHAETGAHILEAVAVLALGWLISRDLARIAPTFFKRMDPATAGTVEFLIRFGAVAMTVLGALYVAGITASTLAVGGAFTAVVLGLAAQQTLGNLIAGTVLLTARPFRIGELVRLQAGAVGGYIEGVVSSLGLLYTTLARGDDRILIPNNVVLSAVVVPLREPDAVDVRVRLSASLRPAQVQTRLRSQINTKTRGDGVTVLLEEIDGDDLVIRVRATPEYDSESAKLADEVITALIALRGSTADPATVEQPQVSTAIKPPQVSTAIKPPQV
jgi:small conductance mechanosensitive channel